MTPPLEVSLPLSWQQPEWQRLLNQLAGEQLPHAMLLTGGSGTGKERFAQALARYLLCASPENGHNCGQCRGCELSRSGAHGDYLWLAPEEKSRVIKIDQVREAIQFSTRTASYGERKVLVFYPAESMNINAFNALLKVLEEPSAGTYLILLCHGLHRVPATIRSRCQLVRMSTPTAEQSMAWLDQITQDPQQSQALLAIAEGRPLLAEALYNAGNLEEVAHRRVGIRQLLTGAMDASEVSALWSDQTPSVFLLQCVTEIQRVLLIVSNTDLKAAQVRAAFALLDEINGLRRAVDAGANPSGPLLLESILGKIQRELGGGVLGDTIMRSQEASTYERN